MKKIYLTLVLLFAFTAIMFAQNEKRLLKLTKDSNSYLTYEYNMEGQLIKWTSTLPDEVSTNIFTYKTDEITQTYSIDGGKPDTRISQINNGRITTEKTSLISEEGTETYTCTYELTYNNEGYLIKITKVGQGETPKQYELTWENGNITRVKHYENTTLIGEIQYTYDTSIENKYLNSLLNPITNILSDEGIISTGQLLEGYYGIRVKNTIKSVRYIGHDSSFGWNANDDFDLTYIKDANGSVVRIEQSGAEQAIIGVEWDDTTTGISHQTMNITTQKIYYDINGIQMRQPKKGLNIIKTEDSKIQKVFIK